MRPFALLLLLCIPLLADEPRRNPLPADVAAQHPEGKWVVRKADLYRYLVRFYGAGSSAGGVLEEYMKRRLIEDEARKRKITVTENDVDRWLAELDAKVSLRSLFKESSDGGINSLLSFESISSSNISLAFFLTINTSLYFSPIFGTTKLTFPDFFFSSHSFIVFSFCISFIR